MRQHTNALPALFTMGFYLSFMICHNLSWFGVFLILGGFSYLHFSRLHALLDGLAAAQALTIPICTFFSPFSRLHLFIAHKSSKSS